MDLERYLNIYLKQSFIETGKETFAIALDIQTLLATFNTNIFLPLQGGSTLLLHPNIYNWFESFLSNRSIKVVVDVIISISLFTSPGFIYLPQTFPKPSHSYIKDNTSHGAPSLLDNRNTADSSIILDPNSMVKMELSKFSCL